MATPSFLFVDGLKPDRATLRQIRSHAMRGKNAGRILPPRQARQSRGGRAKCAARQNGNLPPEPASQYGNECVVFEPGRCSLGDAMRTHRLPLELTPAALQVISKYFCHVTEKMYPPRLGLQLDLYRTVWLQTVLADEAALHCGLALMEACNDFICGDGQAPVSAESLRHLNQGLALVNQRLAGDSALSDATFGLVIMLILHEQVCRKEAAAEIHFQGLTKMVELRGGLDKLEVTGKSSVLKICKLDQSSAWQSGRPLYFFRHHMAAARQHLADMGLDRYWRTAAADVPSPAGLRPELAQVLVDASHVAGFLNTAPAAGHTLRVDTFQEMAVSLCSRLIQLGAPSDVGVPDNTTAADATYHIGLTLFSMTLFLQLGGHRLLNYPRVVQRLRGVLQQEARGVDPCLRLWVLFLGAIWVQGGDTSDDGVDEARFHAQIRDTAEQLGITGGDWTRVHEIVCVFPWVDALHNSVGRDVWTKISNEPSSMG